MSRAQSLLLAAPAPSQRKLLETVRSDWEQSSKAASSVGRSLTRPVVGVGASASPAEAAQRQRTVMNTTKSLPRMVSVDELAETLGVCQKTVRRWIGAGKLRAHHLGRRVLIAEDDAAAFIAAGRR